MLRCLSHGMTERMAGEALGISRDTVRNYTQNARLRLAAKNTTHAVALALRYGFLA